MSKVSARELAALGHACPTCHAKPKEPCTLVKHVLRWGTKRRPHPERIALTQAIGVPTLDFTAAAPEPLEEEAVHTFFGLTYAQYLAVPRSALQSMPPEWQRRFVACLEELDATIDWHPANGTYWVKLKDERGRFTPDPLADYERGRRQLPLKPRP